MIHALLAWFGVSRALRRYDGEPLSELDRELAQQVSWRTLPPDLLMLMDHPTPPPALGRPLYKDLT